VPFAFGDFHLQKLFIFSKGLLKTGGGWIAPASPGAF